MRKIIFIVTILFSFCYAQTDLEPIIVVDLNTTSKSTEETSYYYAFAEGDEIIINWKTLSPKGTNQLYVSEYPNNVKFVNKAFRDLDDVKIKVFKKSIYRFSFATNHLTGRDCKITIKRKPADKNFINFNTNVKFVEVSDTTFADKIEKKLISRDTIQEEILSKEFSISQKGKNFVYVKLPENTGLWAYWIGVGQEANDKMQKASAKIAALPVIAAPIIAVFSLLSVMPSTETQETIDYYVLNSANKDIFMSEGTGQSISYINKGNKISSDFSKLEPKLSSYFICFKNNSAVERNINIKAYALKFNDMYEENSVKTITNIVKTTIPTFE